MAQGWNQHVCASVYGHECRADITTEPGPDSPPGISVELLGQRSAFTASFLELGQGRGPLLCPNPLRKDEQLALGVISAPRAYEPVCSLMGLRRLEVASCPTQDGQLGTREETFQGCGSS